MVFWANLSINMSKQSLIDQNKKSTSKMALLLEQEKDAIKIPQVGDLVEGVVIAIGKNEIHLDINNLTTGVVRGKEIWDESGELNNIKVGDQVAATVIELENENGLIELSFRFAGHKKAWERLENLMKTGEIVMAKVIDANKGGLMIKVGNVIGFLPVSQLTTENYPRVEGGDKNKILSHLKEFIGKEIKSKVIDVNEADEKLIVSEKAAWEEKQSAAMSKYKIGDVVEGLVTGVVDFGAFVEFGDNLEGLVHISELAWQRIDDPREVIRIGDKIKAEIIAIEDAKISLSMKKLQSDPWQDVEKKYKPGQKVKAKVLKINPFGAFVELDTDIHGLVHISELSVNDIDDPKEVVQVGKTYEFEIISIEPKNHRLGLSLVGSQKKASKKKVTEKTEEAKETTEAETVTTTTNESTETAEKIETDEVKE